MIVLVAGAHGRLGSRLVALLLHRGHAVRGLVRTEGQAAALRELGADAVVADLRGDVEWTAVGCDAAVFAAGARHRQELGAIDAGGAAKLAEAADRFDLSRFVLCSVIGAHDPQRRTGGVREFLTAKQQAEQRLARLNVPWTILRFGRLTEAPGTGQVSIAPDRGRPVVLSRDDAALAAVAALERRHLAGHVLHLVDGERAVEDALDDVPPLPLPSPEAAAPGLRATLGELQADNPPDAADMLALDATPMDADVEWVGDGPVPPEPAGNDDPAPGMP
jgi:nucleoside-diphosphate-sugar epimerase